MYTLRAILCDATPNTYGGDDFLLQCDTSILMLGSAPHDTVLRFLCWVILFHAVHMNAYHWKQLSTTSCSYSDIACLRCGTLTDPDTYAGGDPVWRGCLVDSALWRAAAGTVYPVLGSQT